MNIRLVFVVSLLCAGCAATDPFQTFYSPGWQNTSSQLAQAAPIRVNIWLCKDFALIISEDSLIVTGSGK
jgi:hypothetical protein